MKSMRQLLIALSVTAFLCAGLPASAASFSQDQSDLYYNASESGWGLQLVQRNSTIFATLFVYDAAMNPTWFVATMAPIGGVLRWSGTLYATTGPWYATIPFNPSLVTVNPVGTMTWSGDPAGEIGNVSYTVNGIPVNKNVIRQSLGLENYNGHFFGVLHQTASGCNNPAFDGDIDIPSVFNISQAGNAVQITQLPVTGSCTFIGGLTQFGQMGIVQGNYSCSNGAAGLFAVYELQVTQYSVNGLLVASSTNPAGCSFQGWLGGLTVTTF